MRLTGILLSLPFLLSCTDSRLAGTDDVQDTGAIAGVILAADGKPAAAAELALYPEAHDPYADGALPARWRVVTDAAGKFRLDSIPAGRFNLEGTAAGRATRLWLRNVAVDAGGAPLPVNGKLQAPGAFIIPLAAGESRAGDYLYLPGSMRYRVIGPADIAAGEMTLDSVPAGLFPELRLGATGVSRGSILLASSLSLPPGRTVLVNPASAWKHSRRIVINTSPTGAGVSGDLLGFPLLVRLSSPGFDFTRAAGRGEDVRFTKPDGTLLSHETELWDSAQGRAEIWVRLDTLRGGDSSQQIVVHTGNTLAAQSSSAAAVFFPPADFQGVWHLSAFPTTGKSAYPDASGNANHAQPGNGPLAGDGTGPSSRDILLDGGNQFVSTGKRVPGPQAFTLSIWFRTETRSGGRLLSFGDSILTTESNDTDRFLWMSNGGNLHFGAFTNDTPPRSILSSPAAYNDGRWHFAAAVISDSGQALYVDGVKVGETNAVKAGGLFRYTGYWSLGHFVKTTSDWPPTPGAKFFQGSLDEARVQTVAVSGDWVRMCFANQKPGSGVVVLP